MSILVLGVPSNTAYSIQQHHNNWRAFFRELTSLYTMGSKASLMLHNLDLIHITSLCCNNGGRSYMYINQKPAHHWLLILVSPSKFKNCSTMFRMSVYWFACNWSKQYGSQGGREREGGRESAVCVGDPREWGYSNSVWQWAHLQIFHQALVRVIGDPDRELALPEVLRDKQASDIWHWFPWVINSGSPETPTGLASFTLKTDLTLYQP